MSNEKMKLKFYDYETFPEWWCCVVSDEEDSYTSSRYTNKFTKEDEMRIKGNSRVYRSDRPGDYEALIEDLKTGVNTGYNTKRFDQIISKCIALRFTPRQVYIAALVIVGKEKDLPPEMNVTQSEIMRISNYVKGYNAKWTGGQAYQDLMDDSVKGLKDKEASYGMDIRETTVPFGKMNLTEDEKEEIIVYCKHDVYALHVHYVISSRAYIDTKLTLARTYDIPDKVAYASTNAVLSGKVLGAKKYPGTTIKDPTIVIRQKELMKYFREWIPEHALNHLLTSQETLKFKLWDNEITLGDGGIHSTIITPRDGRKKTNIYVESDEEYGIFNIDLSGCHPSVMIFVDSMPRGITRPERFKQTVYRRRELKAIPKSQWTRDDDDYVTAGKLIHNTTYGAAGNKYLPLYDDYMRSRVCRISQMVILAVGNAVYEQLECRIIQTNTDGIMIYMKRDLLPKLEEIVKYFESFSNFLFDIEEDTRVWQANVNNYIAVHPDGGVKTKGRTYITSIFQPGYYHIRPLSNYGLVSAQTHFYMTGENPLLHLFRNDKVSDFVTTGTKGGTFYDMVVETANGDISLGKVCRIIAVKDESLGYVKKLKRKPDGTIQENKVPDCPPHSLIVNDDLNNYKIYGDVKSGRFIENIITGESWELDMLHYTEKLVEKLNVSWYKLSGGKLEYTRQFNV